MPRMAHHRKDFRTGLHHGRQQRRTYLRTKVCKQIHASRRMAVSMRCLSPGVYAIPPADRLAWIEALEDAWPYASDETGELWT